VILKKFIWKVKGWLSMSIHVISSLSVVRLNTSKASELWGDEPNNPPRGLSKIIVLVIDRSDHDGPSSQLLNAYGIDPKREDKAKFVFQAVITREQLAAFLQSVVDTGPRPACPRWVSATGTITNTDVVISTGGEPQAVAVPTGDPPTSEPKLTEVDNYAAALAGL
jgi:hypothetical protein